MQNTEKGRKISSAAVNTGRAVVQTGKAVGGVLSQAKGALSQWWSTLPPTESGEVAAEAGQDVLNLNQGVRMSEIDLSSSDGEWSEDQLFFFSVFLLVTFAFIDVRPWWSLLYF